MKTQECHYVGTPLMYLPACIIMIVADALVPNRCQGLNNHHVDSIAVLVSFAIRTVLQPVNKVYSREHTMDLLWEKFQWILPLYMKPISFQSKASVVCSVTTAIFIDFCLKKLIVFSQHIGKKTNEYLNSAEQIPRNWNVDRLSVLITSWDFT